MGFAEIMSLCAGLGLFLMGMTLMSEGIEKAAGAKLRGILEMFTTNRVTGMIVGLVFTAIMQSSSACTSLVVSFVNSGLMTLFQAAGVIFGANIGTTVTSQLVSFNLSAYAPIILITGVVVSMATKNQLVEKIADIVAGFGVLFLGISTMSSGMSALKDSEQVINLLSGLENPILAVIAGLVITAVVQSSSVTVSLVLLMAQQGLFGDVNICLYIILGCNIGACTTALLASLAGKKDAKRAAMIHLLFNIIGTVIMFIIFQIAIDPISLWLHSFSADEGRFVANAHTIIKILQVVMLLPFSNWIVKLTYIVIPGNDQKVGYRDTFQLKYIGNKVIFNPSTAVVDGLKELERMASLASDNLNRAMNALVTLDEEDIQEVRDMEENINFLNKSITGYLIKINQSPLPIDDLQGLGSLFHVANDIERIGDHAENIAEFAERRKKIGATFSDDAIKEMTELLNLVNELMGQAIKVIVGSGSEEDMERMSAMEDAIDAKEKEIQQRHVDRLTRQECSPEAGMIFSDVGTALERVGDHAFNIAVYIIKRENTE